MSRPHRNVELLSRADFRSRVFERDQGACVFCGQKAVDAHHILERRLWPDGGAPFGVDHFVARHYVDNGASVCGLHHLLCEQTKISVEDVRLASGISKLVLPPHLYSDETYDKWGNSILSNGTRLKGELFFDESVQKILAQGGVLPLFTDWVKYPRTHHLPWSRGMHSDDRMLSSMHRFVGQRVIITEKMDGENTSLYTRYMHGSAPFGVDRCAARSQRRRAIPSQQKLGQTVLEHI